MQFLDFGDGHNGSPAVAGVVNSYATCTGSSGSTTLTTTLAVSAGDMILIHQTYGAGAGHWEVNFVISDNGATITLGHPLSYSYATGAQAVIIPQFIGGTISGAQTCTAWNGSIGGIIAIASSGALTISGSLTVSGQGFRGGTSTTGDHPNWSGDGSAALTAQTRDPAGNAGGGGEKRSGSQGTGGGGGGNGTSGANGQAGGVAANWPGVGGDADGNAALTDMVMGGGGGGGSNENTILGGDGGGIILVIAKTLTVTGSLVSAGANGANNSPGTDKGGAGGGAGGSILVKAQIATLGTNKLTAPAGAGATEYWDGGNGGVGRIRCDYYSSKTGSSTPTLSSGQDTNLKKAVHTGMV